MSHVNVPAQSHCQQPGPWVKTPLSDSPCWCAIPRTGPFPAEVLDVVGPWPDQTLEHGGHEHDSSCFTPWFLGQFIITQSISGSSSSSKWSCVICYMEIAWVTLPFYIVRKYYWSYNGHQLKRKPRFRKSYWNSDEEPYFARLWNNEKEWKSWHMAIVVYHDINTSSRVQFPSSFLDKYFHQC